ncbi:MAG: hypothetical protein ACRC8S_05580 [Fimbriiglobus sp.]
MRRPTFWEAFWFTAILAAPLIGGLVGIALNEWLGAPGWVIPVGALTGIASLFTGVWVVAQLDDHRRRNQTDSGSDR